MAHRFLLGGTVVTLLVAFSLGGCSAGDDGGGSDNGSSSSTTGGTQATSSGGSSTGTTSTTDGSSTDGGSTDGGSTDGGSTDGSTSGQTSGSTGAGGASSSSSTTGGDDCEQVQCLRPYECATSCDAEPSYVGCCPCDEGMVDQFVECSDAGDCGGDTCSADEYCAKPDGECDGSDALGSCAPMPDACTLEYAPVCGCDGMTYGNSCGAASAGVNVASEGECALD